MPTTLIYAQSYRIIKIIETNLFELENGQKVKFYGLYIPSQQDTSKALTKLADNIKQWETDYMLDRSFKFEFISKDGNDIFTTVIFRSHAFSDENLANRLLSIGYASLLVDTEKKYYAQLIGYQEQAQKAGLGLWKESLTTLKSIDSPIFDSQEEHLSFPKKYENVNIPLLVLGVASFVLAWDSFSTVSDIQATIDNIKSVSKEIDVSELETSLTRKSIVGVTCLIAGVISTLYSFKSIEVKTNFKSVSMNYRF